MGNRSASMPAAVYVGGQRVELQQVPVPAAGAGEVLIEVAYCGVCGTDLHMVMDGWGEVGAVFGHEYSGTVVAVGEGVVDRVPGDLVVGGPGPGCGQCRLCRAGRPNLCAGRDSYSGSGSLGAFARFKAVDGASTYRIPRGLDLRSAALAEPLAVALHGVRRGAVLPGDPVLVTGGGPIGLLTVALLQEERVEVTVSEPAERRRELAASLGATVLSPDRLERPALATELAARPFRVAFECSGRPEAMEDALSNLDTGGILVLSGTGMRRPRLDPNRIILHELSVTGTVDSTPDEYRAALDLLAAGRLPVESMLEPDDQPLSAVQQAMEQLSDGHRAGKVLIAPNA